LNTQLFVAKKKTKEQFLKGLMLAAREDPI